MPELAHLAEETGLDITVCHLPPGISKWNKIEHPLFSHISMNWRGRPLESHDRSSSLTKPARLEWKTVSLIQLEGGPRQHGRRDLSYAFRTLRPNDWHFAGKWRFTAVTPADQPERV